jgi:hypothetical protein
MSETNSAREARQRRRARVRNSIHRDHNSGMEKTLNDMKGRIQNCLGLPFALDHIIPLSKGGPHHHLNLQVIPSKINLLKNNNMDFIHPLLIHWTDLPREIVGWSPRSQAPKTVGPRLKEISKMKNNVGIIDGMVNMLQITEIETNFIFADSGPVAKKLCVHCHEIKRVESFRASKECLDGLQSWCDECRRGTKLKKSAKLERERFERCLEWERKAQERRRLESEILKGCGGDLIWRRKEESQWILTKKAMPTENKVCNKCGEVKIIGYNFKPSKGSRDGWHQKCNECRCAYAKEHSKKYIRNKNTSTTPTI